MKYIIKNIHSFIKKEKTVFILMLLCILSSSVIILFSFGFYHHIEQKKLDEQSGENVISLTFTDEAIDKQSVINTLHKLSSNILDHSYMTISFLYDEDATDDPVLNVVASQSCAFSISNGKIAYPQLFKKDLDQAGYMTSGHYITEQEFNNNEYVCVAFPENIEMSDPDQAAIKARYTPDANNYYTIHGKKYKCVGYTENINAVPAVPVGTVEDNIRVCSLEFVFDHVITKAQYTEVIDLFSQQYGDGMDFWDLDIQEIDNTQFYNSLLLLCIIISIMSAGILTMLFEYILLQRRRQLTIYRLCGLTIFQARMQYFLECFCSTSLLYVASAVLFHFFILPYAGKVFEYMSLSYSLRTYGLIGIIYIGITSIILYLLICLQIPKNISSGLKEA